MAKKSASVNPTTTHNPEQVDLLRFALASISLWSRATQTAREKFKRDFDITEGNGKQWLQADKLKVTRSRRPALEFNQILPQVELVTGMQRVENTEYVAKPRGVEDVRLGEIVTTTLKASRDYMRLPRVNAKVFDDATICGLGVWRLTHNIVDAQDILWGDIKADRINPLAYLWDPWALPEEGFQDGAFMGDLSWMTMEAFHKKYPKMNHLAKPGEWIDQAGKFIGDSQLFGVGDNLRRELYDAQTGRIRIITLWYKKPTVITLLVNTDSGQVTEVRNEAEGQQQLSVIAQQMGKDAVNQFQIMNAGSYTSIMDPTTGTSENFATPEAAQTRLAQLSEATGLDVYERMKVIKREARVPYWCELVWGQILESGPSPYTDRKYPYVPYVSRMLQDDPESIMGIVRNLWDPQDEYNKRYSNLLAHATSSSHSGWLNRKSGGANTSQLERMGSTPGVVVEYAGTPPSQIKPTEMSNGHFNMVNLSGQNILRISGVNAEMVGSTTQKTVSGRAIEARQSGGSMVLQPRFFNFSEAELDVTWMALSRIQQYYPPEKIRRIIGLLEAAQQGTGMPPTVFADPITGMPMTEDEIHQTIVRMTNLQFDLALKKQPADPTQREADFSRAMQMAELIMRTGRPLGPNTVIALADMADFPSRFAEGLKRDMMMAPTGPVQPGSSPVSKQIAGENGGHRRDGNGGPGPQALNMGA